jgi:hypothetical protein
MLSSPNACLVADRVSVTLFPRFAQNLMPFLCWIQHQTRHTNPNNMMQKISMSTQLHEILYSDSQDMLVLLSTFLGGHIVPLWGTRHLLFTLLSCATLHALTMECTEGHLMEVESSDLLAKPTLQKDIPHAYSKTHLLASDLLCETHASLRCPN